MSRDISVIIEPSKYAHSSVTLEMSNMLIEKIEKEVEAVSGDRVALNFGTFVNNALIQYINSYDWNMAKEEMIRENEED